MIREDLTDKIEPEKYQHQENLYRLPGRILRLLKNCTTAMSRESIATCTPASTVSNLLVVGYSISAPNTDTYVDLTAVTQQGFKLSGFSADELAYPKATDAPFYDAFNTSDITSLPQRLTVQLSGPVTQRTLTQVKRGQAKTLGNVSFTVSVPVHMGKVLTPHQSVTVNGHTATLERVVITPTLTSIYVSGYSTLPNGFFVDSALDVQNHSSYPMSSGPDDTLQNGTWVSHYTDNLYQSSGTWKLTVWQVNASNPLRSNPWTFQFPVR